MRLSKVLRLILWAGISSTLPVVAADWPMYRGQPDLIGLASGDLPAKPALLWSFKTQGPVKSSAAIVGNRVYV
ncbi:MAG: PQQ-binding-like beta-propeller repeat protein, partial [Verrucomicrobiota bacterium]